MSAEAFSQARTALGPAAGTAPPTRHPTLVALTGLVFGSVVVGLAATEGLLAGLAAVLAVAAVLWAARNQTAAALAVVAIVPAISGMRRGLPVPGLRLGELLTVGFAAMVLVTAPRVQWRRWRAFDWLALGYVVATFALGVLDTWLRNDSLTRNDLGQLVGPLQFLLLYRAVLIALPRREDRVRALDRLLIGSLIVGALTLLQAARVPGVGDALVAVTGQDFSSRLTWAVPRANGPFPHWTMLAGYLFGIAVLCSALLLGGVRGRRRRLAAGALAVAAVCLVLTVTLAPMLGALAGALALAWWYRRAGRAAAYAALACVVLAVAFQPLLSRRTEDQFQGRASSSAQYSLVPRTVSNRVDFWREQYLPALDGRWIAGYGPQIPPEVTWQFTESVYISMVLRGGLPLLALYLGLSLALALMALDVSRRAPPRGREEENGSELRLAERALGRAVFVIVALLAVLQLTAPYFVTTGLPHLWWIVAALVAGALEDR